MPIIASSVEETLRLMREKLSKVVPEFELREKAEIVFEINRLKKERGAIILGHNYMEPALFHTVPDIVGDSLELSRKAAETNADPIIFCGVSFMAETAKILNPSKTVLLPAKKAGCSLAAGITAEDVRKLREQLPDAPFVTYINTYADVKAEVDICCTSGNAARVVNALLDRVIVFLPDEYLSQNVAEETGRQIVFPDASGKVDLSHIPEGQKIMVGWRARCEVHEQFTVGDIERVRSQFPGVEVLAHPECSPEVVHASDFSASTSKMVDKVRESRAPHFLLLTECSMGDNIIAENPEKDILRLCSIRCPYMNQITLEDTLDALRHNRYEVTVPEEIRVRAERSLRRMLEF